MITLTDILVATDFSEPSIAALTYGRELARYFRTRLHILHVVGSLPSAFIGAEAYVVSVPDLQRQIEDAARQELDALPIDDDDVPPIRRVVMTSNAPHAAIVDYATQEHIGLIVAGTHGRSAVTHALVGRECGGAHRSDRAVSGSHRPQEGAGIRRPRYLGCARHGVKPEV